MEPEPLLAIAILSKRHGTNVDPSDKAGMAEVKRVAREGVQAGRHVFRDMSCSKHVTSCV